MLGYVVAKGRGAGDILLYNVAMALRDGGMSVAGAVQVNNERPGADKCDMDLHILSGQNIVRISQNLGSLSKGCRLDPAGLEQAVGLVDHALTEGVALLIVNKFGKQEIDGRGFRPVIGQALAQGVPVLVAVNESNLPAFEEFAGGMGTQLSPNATAVQDWVHSQTGAGL